jgi:hypothetical protein
VVAIFLFVAAVVALVTAASLLFPNPFWNRMWDLNRPAYLVFERLGRLPGVLLLARELPQAWLGQACSGARNGLGGLHWPYSQSMVRGTWLPYF